LSKLQQLKQAVDLSDLAKMLDFTPKGLSYVLYKIDPSVKYHVFDIPKKTGGTRTIKAPEKRLSFLQTQLSKLLSDIVVELQTKNARFWKSSHAFQKQKTIITNAIPHRNRHFVFNIDLEDFFGTINFGRVRGFFIKDGYFSLNPKVATVIAQIACHDDSLPQGSPCSPVISNLIGNILDMRLLALARDAKCTYTRYADDLTFSTNKAFFPDSIAINTPGDKWEVSRTLERQITRAGFKIKDSKTRMSLRISRQMVTGLVVNKKINIKREYYRSARAMCAHVFQKGSYTPSGGTVPTDNLNFLEGMLSHIYFVKARRDRPHKINKMAEKADEFQPPLAFIEMYRKFLFYKFFIALTAPILLTEGVSDITYLKCAIHSLGANFPKLSIEKNGKYTRLINFLNPSGLTRDILNLGHGADGQAGLVAQYSNSIKKYKHRPMAHPVIILCDNDEGPKKVFKNAHAKTSREISIQSTDPFYYLGDNLYIVKVPEGNPIRMREIEDLFPKGLLAERVEGKPFNPKKDHGDEASYGKVIFAEKVVRPKAKSIDFSDFHELLFRIEQCILHYEKVMQSNLAAEAA
jgi:RNA-directed DNA polymerase